MGTTGWTVLLLNYVLLPQKVNLSCTRVLQNGISRARKIAPKFKLTEPSLGICSCWQLLNKVRAIAQFQVWRLLRKGVLFLGIFGVEFDYNQSINSLHRIVKNNSDLIANLY